MRILGLTAPVFAAACYVVAADDGDCVVVDPGGGVADAVRRTVAEHGLRVAGVVATHGHADHVADAGVLAAEAGVPLRLHARDAYRLADPLGTLGLGAAADPGVAGALRSAAAAAGLDPATFGRVDPALVAPFGGEGGGAGDAGTAGGTGRTSDVELRLGSVTLLARHAPGHTEGSTLYLLAAGDDRVAFTGDVLFAGSVGRTDLPGGDPVAMAATLRDVVGALRPGTHVLPGHGPATRVDAELATNPYLAN
ncbi:MBL fold metallo-hydrolase [Cellulomonas sp. PS-H5]|uniref:MBL fold metallo-hydrolase n=1 Tax=Cellulomonas sp. PS-H5 TaxID=2820400 RepID=UPI001C4ED444|nr:MBL fold metallo-hydrolase [Cellulomonas sp. PS-H5]MBW0255318.1 MBL fold metallo-hydrolase [Cellulomonas sp. PS-H5]